MMGFDMDMSDLLGVFLEEAEEQLRKLDDGILQLEKDPKNQEIVKEVFRAAHTLKGSSATMGLAQIADLTHAMENLLDCLRNGSAVVTSEAIDLLLNGTGALQTLVSQVKAGEPMDVEVDELLSGLRAMCGSAEAGSKAPPRKKKAEQSPEINPDDGTMALKLVVSESCTMPSVRAFMVFNALANLGDIISADPQQDQLDDIQTGQEISITFRPAVDKDSVIKALKSLAEINLIETSAQEAQEPKRQTKQRVSSEKQESAGESAPKAIQTVRVGVDRLDTLMNLVAELVIDRTRIAQIENNLILGESNEELVQNLGETSAHIGRVVTELQEHIMKVRLLPVEQVFSRFPRMVRDLSHKAGKELDFILQGQETELDRSILEEIVDPLTHLLRNAIDHGIETPSERHAARKPKTARVVLAAKQEENRIIIEVEDDGKGIDVEKVKQAALKKGAVTEELLSRMSNEDALQLIFASGVSTAEKITDISGRGVGMDVVRNNIQGLSGSVEVHTEPGKGTKFRISLPLTLAIIQALLTGVDDRVFVIPLSAVVETFRCAESDVRYVDGKPAINFRGIVLPLVDMRVLFQTSREVAPIQSNSRTFVVINTGAMRVGLVVDRLIGEQEVVIKPLGAFFGDLRGIAGATILGDGRVALIIDVAGIAGMLNRRRFDRSTVVEAA